MKNLFLLPTDKPSRLLKDLVDKTYQFKKEVLYGNRFEVPLSIYITSDEEIKEGDWFLFANKEVKKADRFSCNSLCKKIILTTDQDLIADGIEQISEDVLLKILEHINSGKNIESFDEL